MFKFVAIRCHLLRLKCTKFDFGWGPPQTPLGEAIRRSPRLLAGFEGFTSKRREGKGGNCYKGKGKGAKEEKGDGKDQKVSVFYTLWPQ